MMAKCSDYAMHIITDIALLKFLDIKNEPATERPGSDN